MKGSRLLLANLVFLIAFSQSLPASAARDQTPPPPADLETTRSLSGRLATAGSGQDQLWLSLPPNVRQDVVAFNQVAYVSEGNRVETALEARGSRGLLAAAGCKSVTRSRRAYNVFGQVLWSYYQKIDWCFSGTKITSRTRIRWGEVPWYSLWQYKGHIGSTQSGGVGSWSYRAWTQGEFTFSLVGYPVQYAYPWVDMTVYGNGTSKGSAGG